ncbi:MULTISPECIES: hypothetical protein [unclassified Campylobacter]|uniref:hypothetical protein n=1 Tax=unclassified Campylobacter TaxID=2593542 RepID=UPI001237EAF2|nr:MULTISPECIES: hypothetical protein [unclassified Campylobacter]KAA6226356.1 hypothetical protein FMM57_06125 [Campylobacter sp. LR286c]KAA6226606.1 hypothetical protein FMM54_04110 [Campylobacter sp. LR185c]KAA6226848.1 hypothetical protein FMM55_04695 [Campylobacter sp. LR196d]KAA6230285.1 hypothetical protein FMM58_06325 [Campylobacter sp. LR291e]KAA8603590.1 hypothetical protein CGP82_06250 [Campylobacter sp. LR185c]
MNLKIFSIIVGFFIIILVVLGGTYYYLFEMPEEETIKVATPSFNSINNQFLNTDTINEQALNNKESNSNLALNENLSTLNTNETKESPKVKELKKELKKEVKKEILNEDNIHSVTNTKTSQKLSFKKTSEKTPNLNTIKEYQQRGKDSRLEPFLSTENVKVYIMEGKSLTNYRKGLLKDMLSPIQNRSKDYNLSVFIQMLPKNKMDISIYNKDIIFSEKKKAYKYITLNDISDYKNDLKHLNERVKREEIIKKVNFKHNVNLKGSDFAKHIKNLKQGISEAQYYFPFCEIIQIN